MREVLRLHYGEGLKHAAIADRIGVTRRVVKREIIEAYVRLRVMLAGDDGRIADTTRVSTMSAGGKP